MDVLDRERRGQRRNIAQATGINLDVPRVFQGQVQSGLVESDILSLPNYGTTAAGLQNPVTGNLYFVLGFSQLGGEDELAPGS